MHLVLAEEREGDLGSSNSSNLGQSPFSVQYVHEMETRDKDQTRGSSTAQNCPLVVKVCTGVAGMCL